MTQEGAVPPDLWERVRKIAAEEVAKSYRSAPLKNSSISNGDLTIKGGAFRAQSPAGVDTFYVGPYGPNDPDGNYQPGMIVKRNDGTAALVLWDPLPNSNGYRQFLGWYDRTNHAIITDDTDSGQGLARPYLSGVGYLAQPRYWPGTQSASYEVLWRARHPKQHPKLYVQAWGTCDTAGTTGELQVMVNGIQLGATQSLNSSTVQEFVFGPTNVLGDFGEYLNIELQVRRTAGTGYALCCFSMIEGRQS